MKICFLAAANSIHSVRWIKYFNERGHKIVWISLAPPIPEAAELIKKVDFYEIKPSPLRDINGKKFIFYLLPAVLKLKEIIKNKELEILQIHSAGTYGLIGALANFHPIVLTPWGSDVLLPSSIIKKLLVKFALNKADLITCNGQTLSEEMLKIGINPAKIKFVYWGTDIKKFKPGPKNKELRDKLKIFNSPMIISLRNFEPAYDIETLIKAIPLVLEEVPTAKFVIVGKGSQENKLKKLTQDLKIVNNIRFVGRLPYDIIPDYLNTSDIYVSTSLSDGDLSQGTQQAMACEIPIITTDIKVNKARIDEGKNGLIFLASNADSLARQIIRLLKDGKLRDKLKKNGRATIENVLNYYKNMEEAENLYKELIKPRNYKY